MACMLHIQSLFYVWGRKTVLLWGTLKLKTSWDCNAFPENGSNERKYLVSCSYLEERALMIKGSEEN